MPRIDRSNAHCRLTRSIWVWLAAGTLLCVAPDAGAQDALTGKQKPAAKTDKTPAAKAPLTEEQKEKIAAQRAAAKEAAEKRAATRAAKLEAQRAALEKAAAERKAKAEARRAALDDARAAKKAPAKAEAEDDVPLKGLLRHFYDELKPFGTWADDPTYGLIWSPNEKEVGKSFAPYQTNGRWGVTEKGDWAWVSDKKWGNIPFHYGRWIWTRDKKWSWIPDREYAPAWVVWRVGQPGTPYVGWAPMAPTHYLVDGVPQKQEGGVLPFYFVAARHLFSPKLATHVIEDRDLGLKVQEQSDILPSHVDKESESPVSAPLLPASPAFDVAHIPPFAIPKTRLPLDAEAIKPIVLAAIGTLQGVPPDAADPKAKSKKDLELQDPQPQDPQLQDKESQDQGRFATPPASDAPEEAQAAPTAKKKRLVVRRQGKPRYRCWWTNTSPRIWRCGY